jgi:hypothetical protein
MLLFVSGGKIRRELDQMRNEKSMVRRPQFREDRRQQIDTCRNRPQLQRKRRDDFETDGVREDNNGGNIENIL